jgi:hypothetical protein
MCKRISRKYRGLCAKHLRTILKELSFWKVPKNIPEPQNIDVKMSETICQNKNLNLENTSNIVSKYYKFPRWYVLNNKTKIELSDDPNI